MTDSHEKPRSSRLVKVAIGLAAFVLLITCGCNPFIMLMEIGGRMAIGWILYISRTIPQVKIRNDLVASTTVYVILLVGGSHFFFRWLYRETRRVDEPGDRKWSIAATFRIFGIVFLMFLVGMSAIGVTHQTVWLVQTPGGLFEWDARNKERQRVKCEYHIKNLAAAFITYLNNNEGYYPDDLATLVIKTGLTPSIVICPGSDDIPAEGNDPKTIAEAFNSPGHCSYLYFGKGLTSSIPDDTIILAEPLKNHGNKINVMYADFHVDWIPKEKAEPLLAKLMAAANSPGTHPASAPSSP